MSGGEFVDTNILVYSYDSGAGDRHRAAVELLDRLLTDGSFVVSQQVLCEFVNVGERKLQMSTQLLEAILVRLAQWRVHSPIPEDAIHALRLQHRYQISWWDALILSSAQAMNCHTLWSEDFADGRRFGAVTVRNPFAPTKHRRR